MSAVTLPLYLVKTNTLIRLYQIRYQRKIMQVERNAAL